jgi:hypothetical protein
MQIGQRGEFITLLGSALVARLQMVSSLGGAPKSVAKGEARTSRV